MQICLSPARHAELQELAKTEGMPLSRFGAQLIQEALKAREEHEKEIRKKAEAFRSGVMQTMVEGGDLGEGRVEGDRIAKMLAIYEAIERSENGSRG